MMITTKKRLKLLFYLTVNHDALPSCEFLSEMAIPRGHTAPGFSPDNEVVYGRWTTEAIIKYKLTSSKYKTVWEKTSPGNTLSGSYKFISKSGDIVLQDSEKTTYLTENLEIVAQHKIEMKMYLEFVTDDKLFYVKDVGKLELGNDEVAIAVYGKDKHQLLFSLTSTKTDKKWSLGHNVQSVAITCDGRLQAEACRMPRYYAFTVRITPKEGNIVVVDTHYKSLEIFNDKGMYYTCSIAHAIDLQHFRR